MSCLAIALGAAVDAQAAHSHHCMPICCRSGVRIAIVGPPNAGKSSLLNLLAGHDAAIVSPVAGTTRDLVQVQLELGGNKVRWAPPSPTAWLDAA